MRSYLKSSENYLSANNRLNFAIGIALLSIGWLFLWFAPWQSWLQPYIWLRLGIALTIFVAPGAFLYRLLNREKTNLSNTIAFGFVISHLILALSGAFGRLLHIPFAYVKHGMMFLGLIFMLLFCIQIRDQMRSQRSSFFNLPSVISYWPLAIIIFIAILLSIRRAISYDDLAYLAYLTNWQHANPLDFNDVFFGINEITIKRFWLVSAQFSQAFLSEMSGLHGLFIIGGFYEPFLVFISCISIYNLARNFDLSKQASIVTLVIQITFLALLSGYLHPGFPFFNQLSTDKATAAFILFPVFIQSTFTYFNAPTKNNLLIYIITAFSLSFMHAGIFAFAAFVMGLIIIFRFTLSAHSKYILASLVIVFTLMPQILIRFIDIGSQTSYSYDSDSISNLSALVSSWGDSIFYGFNPNVLSITIPFLENFSRSFGTINYSWLIIPILTMLFAFREIKQNNVAQYLSASFLLVTFAVIPFTGWILGYFLSPLMLERTTWIYPYGIGAVYLLISIRNTTHQKKQSIERLKHLSNDNHFTSRNIGVFFLTIISAGILLSVMKFNDLPNIERLRVNKVRYEELANIGNYLNEHIHNQAIVVGTNEINDFIPGLSSKAKVISFWFWDPFYSYYFTDNERKNRYSDQQEILSNTVSPEKRFQLIQKYNVEYLVLQSGKRYLVNPLILMYPSAFTVTQLGRYLVIGIKY